MGRFVTILLLSVGVLTLVNISLLSYFNNNSFVYFAIYLLNILSILVLSQFYSKETQLNAENKRDLNEKSIGIFIRIFVYFSPVVALFGLYLVSLMDGKKKLGINDANDWVSFILGIASFVMALVSMWQSEGIYNRIFDRLDKLNQTTDAIKMHTDISEALRKQNNFTINPDIRQGISNEINETEKLKADHNKVGTQDDFKSSIQKLPLDNK